MYASRTASKNSGQLPCIANVQNNKDRMYNDMASLIQGSIISNGIAARYESTLRDAGMHNMLNERSCKISTVFSQFTRYNKPESHRHRKRTIPSMSREEF